MSAAPLPVATEVPAESDKPKGEDGQKEATREPTETSGAIAATTAPAPTITASAPKATPATPQATPASQAPATAEWVRSSMARDTAPDVAEADVGALVTGNNAFAFDLYRTLSEDEGNLFFSPLSISVALATAYAGAGGETERQMAETLRFDLPQDRLHPAFNALDLSLTGQASVEGDEGFRLNVANSVWGQDGYGFLSGYLDVLAVNYGEEVRPADFQGNPEDARVRINGWVADETEERIKDLIPPGAITGLTRLVLANAIYFKAAWSSVFAEGGTRDRTFHLLDGSEREVPMMWQKAKLRYAAGDGFQAVELPYKGGEAAMTVLVPDAGRFQEFQGIVDSLDWELVMLSMPRFEMESAFSLTETLEAMGMHDAFDDESANFSGMDGRFCEKKGDICLLISDVLHKAFVSVDEEGTEAAAATAVIIGITRAAPVELEPIELVIDRPFLFTIRHGATGAVLFVGRVLEP